MDLFDVAWYPWLKSVYNPFVEQYKTLNLPLPTQDPDRSKAHRLDCDFLNFAIKLMLRQKQLKVGSVRSAFMEGERIFPKSAIFDLAHVQIAIRNPALIKEIYLIET